MKRLLPALAVAFSLAGCSPFPMAEARTISSVQRDTADTRLGRAVAPMLREHPRESGVLSVGCACAFLPTRSSSLHAKTFSVDRARVFVGSFNFDPRSARLNTEMGVIVDSPLLADRIADVFDQQVPLHAYEVRLGDHGKLHWIERVDGRRIVHDDEPYASFGRRLGAWFVSLLPIEWLL